MSIMLVLNIVCIRENYDSDNKDLSMGIQNIVSDFF